MKISKEIIEKIKKDIIRSYDGIQPLPRYWNNFIDNLNSHVAAGVFTCITTVLLESLPDEPRYKGKYFLPLVGINIAKNDFNRDYNELLFKGYIGFGCFKNQSLNTDVIFKLISETIYTRILRIDLGAKVQKLEVNVITPNNSISCCDNENLFYFSRLMKYNVPKNTKGTPTVGDDFEGTIKRLLTYLGSPMENNDFRKIGAIEFILSDDIVTTKPNQNLVGKYLFDAIHK
jgi:hypothetical protein